MPSRSIWRLFFGSPRAPTAGRLRKAERDDLLAYYQHAASQERTVA